MIPEQREQLERQEMGQPKKPKLKNELQQYLRQEFSYKSLQDPKIKMAAIERLAIKAKDFALKNDLQMNDKQAFNLSKYAVLNFLNNWEDKEEGEDDRSHWIDKFVDRYNGECIC